MLDEFNTSDYEQSIKKYPDWKNFLDFLERKQEK
jgi:hypothetical protein